MAVRMPTGFNVHCHGKGPRATVGKEVIEEVTASDSELTAATCPIADVASRAVAALLAFAWSRLHPKLVDPNWSSEYAATAATTTSAFRGTDTVERPARPARTRARGTATARIRAAVPRMNERIRSVAANWSTAPIRGLA